MKISPVSIQASAKNNYKESLSKTSFNKKPQASQDSVSFTGIPPVVKKVGRTFGITVLAFLLGISASRQIDRSRPAIDNTFERLSLSMPWSANPADKVDYENATKEDVTNCMETMLENASSSKIKKNESISVGELEQMREALGKFETSSDPDVAEQAQRYGFYLDTMQALTQDAVNAGADEMTDSYHVAAAKLAEAEAKYGTKSQEYKDAKKEFKEARVLFLYVPTFVTKTLEQYPIHFMVVNANGEWKAAALKEPEQDENGEPIPLPEPNQMVIWPSGTNPLM